MDFYAGSRDFLAFIVRAIGLVVLILGLWLALEVLHEAWQLYHEPARIERFAKAIEAGSNIDRSIAPLQMDESDDRNAATNQAESSTDLNAYGQPQPSDRVQTQTDSQATEPQYRLRLSYYIAWVIALMLLLVLARIALSAMRTGGELVLYETQMKRFARELVRETLRGRDNQDK